MRRRICLFLMLSALVCAVPVPAGAVSLGAASDYNAFILGDFTGENSDVQGSVAVGGSASFSSYRVGSSLVVGGNLSYTNGTVVGSVQVGGSANTTGFSSASLFEGTALPIDFTTEASYLKSLSSDLSTESANGSCTYTDSWLYLAGDGTSNLQVFNVKESDLMSASSINLSDIAEGATVIINVDGEAFSLTNKGFHGLFEDFQNNVLFNFYEATTLDIASIGIQGSILAPLADVVANYGNIYGTIIANSWKGAMEMHNAQFTNTESSLPVPEPGGTMILVSCGLLLGIGGSMRKKKKQ